MRSKPSKLHIGLRTLKTAAAVILSMVIVNLWGTTSSKLIFAMLGAMAAVQPTFKESVEASLTQIIGVLFGAAAGVVLMALPLNSLAATGIGIVVVISLYNAFHIRFSPGLPCLIVVMLCTGGEPYPIQYALGRIWDTAIGLGVGMLINTLVFPYDNSRQIRSSMASLDREVVAFLEELFDGDSILPDTHLAEQKIREISSQLAVFSNQKLFLHLRRQKEEILRFQACQGKARELVAHMEMLCRLPALGLLTPENRENLIRSGANIRQSQTTVMETEMDIITNYHVSQLLRLRQELMDVLNKKNSG